MSDMEMSDLLGLFLEEAEEQLQRLDEGILQLEKEPGNIEILKEIFRAAHTLKGSSATMGFTEITNLTHAMENLLDSLRNGVMVANPEIVDLLLNGTESLRTLLSQVSRGEPLNLDVSELVASLKAVCGTNDAQPVIKEVNLQTPDKQVEAAPDSLTLSIKIVDNCLMPSVRAFMVYNALSGLGEVVFSDPPQEKIDDIQAGEVISITFMPIQSGDEVVNAIRSLSEVELVGFTLPEQSSSVLSENPQPSASKADGSTETVSKSIQTVRVGVDRLDILMNLIAELVIDRTRINRIESELSNKYENEELVQGLAETAVHIGRVVTELQEHIMKVRLLPVGQVFSRFPRMVRDLSRKAGKEIEFILEGQDTELDRSILEEIVDPITHLLRNAVDHGVEDPEDRVAAGKPRTARVILAAKQEENRIFIEVEEDGKGIDIEKVKRAALKKGVISEDVLVRMSDEDALQLIFAPGLSTADKITDISGRGVGMDVVRNNIQSLSGTVSVHTEVGKGTKFRISLPLTLAIIQALVTGVDERIFVIPLSAVVETFRCEAADVRYLNGQPAINFRGSVLPLIKLGTIFDGSLKTIDAGNEPITFVVVNTGALKIGLIVDKLIGEQEVVIKPLGAFFGDLPGIAGATILGDGRVALIVDVAGLGYYINRRKHGRGSAMKEA